MAHKDQRQCRSARADCLKWLKYHSSMPYSYSLPSIRAQPPGPPCLALRHLPGLRIACITRGGCYMLHAAKSWLAARRVCDNPNLSIQIEGWRGKKKNCAVAGGQRERFHPFTVGLAACPSSHWPSNAMDTYLADASDSARQTLALSAEGAPLRCLPNGRQSPLPQEPGLRWR